MHADMQITYASIKHLHLAAVALTITLFAVRTGWMLASPDQLKRRWVRTVPHVIDTVLLLSGVWLAFQLGAAGVGGWLPAKLIGLVVYIALGTVAIKRGRTRGVRIGAAVAAFVVFAWIVSVALTKSPLGFLAL
jgi:uncharacterized membrane protein SirB2